jgi:hypothetical protein
MYLSATLGKGTHSKACYNTVLKEKIYHLVIHNVIVCPEYAPTVIGGFYGIEHRFIARLVHFGCSRSEPVVLFVIVIELYSVIGAVVIFGAALNAKFGRTRGGVLTSEVGKRAETVHLEAFFAYKPLQNIHIVAGFLKYHGRSSVGVSPISAHEAMTLMKVADTLDMLYIHHVADFAADYHAFQCVEEGGVS